MEDDGESDEENVYFGILFCVVGCEGVGLERSICCGKEYYVYMYVC